VSATIPRRNIPQGGAALLGVVVITALAIAVDGALRRISRYRNGFLDADFAILRLEAANPIFDSGSLFFRLMCR